MYEDVSHVNFVLPLAQPLPSLSKVNLALMDQEEPLATI